MTKAPSPRLIGSHTPDGYVVRRIFPTREEAWRWNGKDSWSHCAGHKGPWLGINAINVPAEVLRLVAQEND